MNGYMEQRGKDSWRLAVYLGRDERTGARRYKRMTVRGSRHAVKETWMRS
jgi:hypothetical protein